MPLTAKLQGLARCPICHQLNAVQPDTTMACGRCGSAIHLRAEPALYKVWAILLSAMMLYLPANLLPVMTVISLGKDSSDTLMGGVIHFMQSGAWALAFIVFTASIFVPMLKMLVLTGLLLSVQFRWCHRLKDQTRLYRLIEFVGKWSMVDVFVIALLVALVQFGEFASVQVGPGTLSFASVVLLTLWATSIFDMRWLWDVCADQEECEDV
jgi:paraquat-inducible protein A